MRLRPVPMLAAALFTAACGGGGGESQANPPAAETPQAAAPAAAASGGEALYVQRTCVTCHQANGEGLPGVYPPLAGSEYVNAADPTVPARILIHGISGPITVKGTEFNGLMPAYGTGVAMNDEEVAQILTYIRSSWGNNAPAVTAADVAKAREATASQSGPMTSELLKPLMK